MEIVEEDGIYIIRSRRRYSPAVESFKKHKYQSQINKNSKIFALNSFNVVQWMQINKKVRFVTRMPT